MAVSYTNFEDLTKTTPKSNSSKTVAELQKEADFISDRATRTFPRLPKELRQNHFASISASFEYRRQKYIGSMQCQKWTFNIKDEDALDEFNRINDWRQRSWYTDISLKTLESNNDFIVSQDILFGNLSHKPHLMAFAYNNTDKSYSSSTLDLYGLKFLALEAPLTEPAVRSFRNLMHNHHVNTLVRLTAHCELDNDNVSSIKCMPYWSKLCSKGKNGTKLTIPLESERPSDPAYELNYIATDDWKDNDGGNAQRLLDLVLEARKVHDSNEYMAVHCHSGVARSGTFIACYALIHEIDKQVLSGVDPKNVNISLEDAVRRGSLQRFHFVGRGSQHVTLHRSIDLYVKGLMEGKYKPMNVSVSANTSILETKQNNESVILAASSTQSSEIDQLQKRIEYLESIIWTKFGMKAIEPPKGPVLVFSNVNKTSDQGQTLEKSHVTTIHGRTHNKT